MTVALFFIFGALTLGAAVGVVLARNPVHSALFLVLTLVSVAVLFLLQDAQLVAAVQIIVYAGAIVVLFLFVIMLLGVDRPENFDEPLRFQRPIALGLGWAMGELTGCGRFAAACHRGSRSGWRNSWKRPKKSKAKSSPPCFIRPP